MHPRRYKFDSDGRIVLVGLNSDETLEFELLDQLVSRDSDGAAFEGPTSFNRLSRWLELYQRQQSGLTHEALIEIDSTFVKGSSPSHARIDQRLRTRPRFQNAHSARRPQTKIVAVVLAGIVILFVAGLTLII